MMHPNHERAARLLDHHEITVVNYRDPEDGTPVPAVALQDMFAFLLQTAALIRDLTDRDPCWFDHHGGCQAHGYLSLEPGELCPQQAAKDWQMPEED